MNCDLGGRVPFIFARVVLAHRNYLLYIQTASQWGLFVVLNSQHPTKLQAFSLADFYSNFVHKRGK